MNTYNTLRIRQNSLRFGALLLALLGLLLLGAKPSQAGEIYFNMLNPKTGTMKTWQLRSFSWEASNANHQPTSFNIAWSLNAAAEIIEEAAATGTPIAHASLTFYDQGKPYLTYKFTNLQVMSWQVGGGAGGVKPIESATLTFQQFSIVYNP